MSEAKHTPGPWAHRNGRIFQADHEVLTIANVARAFDGDYSPSNGNLISAAPEMLSSMKGPQFRTVCDRLEALIAFYIEKVGPDYEEIAIIRQQINDIKSAIAKAEAQS